MKTIGLIGGMSWESSMEYYKLINLRVNQRYGGLHSGKILMNSLNFDEIDKLQQANDWDSLGKKILNVIDSLECSGADFIGICTNTLHKIVPDIEKESGLKIIHIAHTLGKCINESGCKRIGLLGTRYTMKEDFYKKILTENYDIDTVIPEEKEIDQLNNIIFDELCKGIFSYSSRKIINETINRLLERNIDGIVLGCTELPILINPNYFNVPVFDTLKIHAEALADFAMED
jgi:aspartate racemase